MRLPVILLSGLLLAGPAFAQASGGVMTGSGAELATRSAEVPEDAERGGEAGEDGERRICRRVETATGSRMSYQRVCMTARQWRDYNRRN